jgi:hypothetical protein
VYTFLGVLHMAFCICGSWVQVFCYLCFADVWAPFEETLLQCFHQGGDFWIAQRLVGKRDCIGTGSYGMGECSHVDEGWVVLINKIFSQHAAPCHADGSWSNGEGLNFGGGVFIAMQNNLILVFNFIPTVGKNNLAARFA